MSERRTTSAGNAARVIIVSRIYRPEPSAASLFLGSVADALLERGTDVSVLSQAKLGAIARTGAALVATGNIGCMTQLGTGGDLPVVHTVELLDWMAGGPEPAGVARARELA